jgi:hypothetical protein
MVGRPPGRSSGPTVGLRQGISGPNAWRVPIEPVDAGPPGADERIAKCNALDDLSVLHIFTVEKCDIRRGSQ